MPLSLNEIRDRARAFAREWDGETSERAEAQSFWSDFDRQARTAARYLRELVDIGMLQEQRMGKGKLFLHTACLQLLSNADHHLPPCAANNAVAMARLAGNRA